MGKDVYSLNSSEIDAVLQQAQSIAQSAQSFVSYDEFIFFAAFDGTNNDRNDLTASGTTQSTNVAQLYDQVVDGDYVQRRYFPGPGTDGSLIGSSAIPFQVTREIISTAEEALDQFALEAAEWLDSHPTGSVTSMITGFSRGGATAVVFSQMLYERGLIDPRNGNVMFAPGEVGVSAALIYDPVTTGFGGNLAFAPNAENITVIRAMDEFRTLFPAAEFNDSRIRYVDVYGNHGDIGGFYDQGIGALTLEGGANFFLNSGLNILSVPANRAFDPSQAAIHTEGLDEFGSRIWDETGSRGSRLTESVGIPGVGRLLPDGSSVLTFTLYDGRVVRHTTDIVGNVTIEFVDSGVQTLNESVERYGPSLIDGLSLIKAIQTGEPLPVAVSGLRLAASIDLVNGEGIDYDLSAASSLGSGILSLMSLNAALERGDELGAISSGAQSVFFTATAFSEFATSQAFAAVSNGGMDLAAESLALQSQVVADSVGKAIPYLSLVNSIANGDEVGSPESYWSISEAMIRSALARGAIAPEWEVRTARPVGGFRNESAAGRMNRSRRRRVRAPMNAAFACA